MSDLISVTRVGAQWAVKHDGGFLGFAHTRNEAALIGEGLVGWLVEQGRGAELVFDEPHSFSPK